MRTVQYTQTKQEHEREKENVNEKKQRSSFEQYLLFNRGMNRRMEKFKW